MSSRKRKAATELKPPQDKKGKKQWQTPRRGAQDQARRQLEPGMMGIWATCDMGKERRCEHELQDLFEEYASSMKLHGDGVEEADVAAADGGAGQDVDVDIEAEITKELNDIRELRKKTLFSPVRFDTQCITFFETRRPVEPVSFVEHLCRDAFENPERKRGRFVKRLTPVSMTGKATEAGLDEVAQKVLAPHFHGSDSMPRKFAIRPNIRNHNTLSRDVIIRRVAAAVGPNHKVDLKGYDVLILVEIYKNICGMSVVSNRFEELKRFNLAELYQPTASAIEGAEGHVVSTADQ